MTVTYRSTHGLMLGIMTPAWMKYCYKRNLPLFARFCVNCLGAKMDYMWDTALTKPAGKS